MNRRVLIALAATLVVGIGAFAALRTMHSNQASPDTVPPPAQHGAVAAPAKKNDAPETNSTSRGVSGIITGVGAAPDAEDKEAMQARLRGNLPGVVELREDVDIANRYQCADTRFAFALAQPAHVSLTVHAPAADAAHAHTLLDTELAAGAQRIDVLLAHAPLGDLAYELNAKIADGSVQTISGILRHSILRFDAMPLAHTMVKNIHLFDGHLSLRTDDVAMEGRGPKFELTRMYSSNAGDDIGALGRGWISSFEFRVRVDPCGQAMVIGSGQAQRFARTTSAPGSATAYRALYGYHGVLIPSNGDFDFYSKDGTHFHFAERSDDGARLSYEEDTNGNRITYTYTEVEGARRLTSVRDGNGRELVLGYRQIMAPAKFVVLATVDGPLGLHIDYDYDENANLHRVRAADASKLGGTDTEYGYKDFGDVPAPSGEATTLRQHVGYRLVSVRDAIAGATREYRYEPASIATAADSGHARQHVQMRVVSVVEPDGGETDFGATGIPGSEDVKTIVTRPSKFKDTYFSNAYGATERTETSSGTTLEHWDTSAWQPSEVIDGDGLIATYTYDESGNKTREVLVHPVGGKVERSWSFMRPEKFTRPYIRDHVAVFIDGRGIPTRYAYDASARLLTRTRSSRVEKRTYAANGDVLTFSNAPGEVWTYAYDQYGFLASTKDPEGAEKKVEYDARGRKLAELGITGRRTESHYDARDREIWRTPPAEVTSEDPVTIDYDDRLSTKTRTDRNGRKIVVSYDPMGRAVKIVDGDGRVWSVQYDFEGNKLKEIDFARKVTTSEYDAADRLVKQSKSDGSVSEYGYDAAGNIIVERNETADGKQELTETRYEHPLYKPTWQRVRTLTDKPAVWLQSFDGNGNRIRLQTPEGHVSEFHFDDFDHQVDVKEQIGL
jgi:YD repeat-containing protein